MPPRRSELDAQAYIFEVRQQPRAARACGNANKPDRRPIDPVIVLQLVPRYEGQAARRLCRATMACHACLLSADTTSQSEDETSRTRLTNLLTGTTLASASFLKIADNDDRRGAFFVFGDLNVRTEGRYRLRFEAFEIGSERATHLASCVSDVFTVYAAKRFPGMSESTELSRHFAGQGLKIRIRRDVRTRKEDSADSKNLHFHSNRRSHASQLSSSKTPHTDDVRSTAQVGSFDATGRYSQHSVDWRTHTPQSASQSWPQQSVLTDRPPPSMLPPPLMQTQNASNMAQSHQQSGQVALPIAAPYPHNMFSRFGASSGGPLIPLNEAYRRPPLLNFDAQISWPMPKPDSQNPGGYLANHNVNSHDAGRRDLLGNYSPAAQQQSHQQPYMQQSTLSLSQHPQQLQPPPLHLQNHNMNHNRYDWQHDKSGSTQ